MTQNKVMKLWTAIVTAFLALCTTLGLITTTAAAAVPQAIPARNTEATVTDPGGLPLDPVLQPGTPPDDEATDPRRGPRQSSPSCRHRAPADREDATDTAASERSAGPRRPGAPLQR